MRYFVYFSSYLSFCTTNSENGSLCFRFFVSAVFCEIKEATGDFLF